MTGIIRNPKSKWVGNGKSGGSFTDNTHNKGLFHATITPSTALPGYNNGYAAPHETLLWLPITKLVTSHQHTEYSTAARALRNLDGGVQTNRDGVRQWELSGYLGNTTPKGEFDILTAPSTYWEQVADILGPVIRSWDIKAAAVNDWTPNGKLSYSVWDNFSGLLAHVNAPENTHWDLPIPGWAVDLLMVKIFTDYTPGPDYTGPISVPTYPMGAGPKFPFPDGHYFYWPDKDDSRVHSGFFSAGDRYWLRVWQKQMRIRGYEIDVDGFYGGQTEYVAKVFKYWRDLGNTGKIGASTWNASWKEN